MLPKGVEIASDVALEECCVLRYVGDIFLLVRREKTVSFSMLAMVIGADTDAKVLYPDGRDVDAVDGDGAARRISKAQKGQRES